LSVSPSDAPVTLNANPTVTVSGAGTVVEIDSPIGDGSGNQFTKDGPGTLILLGASTFTGGLTISGGVVRVESSNTLGSGSAVVKTGCTLLLGVPCNGYVTLAGGTLGSEATGVSMSRNL